MIIEQVKFTTHDSSSNNELLLAKEQSDLFLRNQPGFRYREFKYSEEDRCWIDEIFWDSLEEAKAAAENFPNAPECKSFMGNINTVISLSHIDGADTTPTLKNA